MSVRDDGTSEPSRLGSKPRAVRACHNAERATTISCHRSASPLTRPCRSRWGPAIPGRRKDARSTRAGSPCSGNGSAWCRDPSSCSSACCAPRRASRRTRACSSMPSALPWRASIWALGSRARLSMDGMQWVDVGGTWLICASFATMAIGYARLMIEAGDDASPAIFVGLLATTYTLLARAIAIPSTTARTLAVGLGVDGPAAADRRAHLLPSARRWGCPLAATVVDVVTWQLGGVAMSVVASRVIFGLRAEVAEIRRLGQYTLGEKVGEGGMGVVYRAHHAMLRRPTAIKLLPPEKAGAENIQRFEREVQLTASLSHPNTVAIFDYGRTLEGVFYYAMEYLDGINLDQLVKLDGAAAGGPGRAHPAPGERCAGRSASHRARPPRHQARQHHPVRARRQPGRRQGRRLRPGEALPDRGHGRHARLDDRADTARDAAVHGAGDRNRRGAISTPAATSTRSARSPICSSRALRCFKASPWSKSWRIISTRRQSRRRAAWAAPCPRARAGDPPVPGEDIPTSDRRAPAPCAIASGTCRDIDDWSDDDASRWWLQHRRRAAGRRCRSRLAQSDGQDEAVSSRARSPPDTARPRHARSGDSCPRTRRRCRLGSWARPCGWR